MRNYQSVLNVLAVYFILSLSTVDRGDNL